MIGLPASVRLYLFTSPCDMRRVLDGLKALAEHGVGVDPLGGNLFVFRGRRGDRVKILEVQTCWGASPSTNWGG